MTILWTSEALAIGKGVTQVGRRSPEVVPIALTPVDMIWLLPFG